MNAIEEGVLSMHNSESFKHMGARLEELHAAREQAAFAAFSMLEERWNEFSDMLIIGLGDRTRAVWWMCTRQRSLEGKNAYQVIADGEQDRLWDVVEDLCGTQEC
ncbi:hypothetical protein [Dyella choica]|uniref:DUF2384 domain-containing protein n=1 Tax=Dyella choica TaxID=1927959 RepID=A0A3S0PK59_9GAMM|nr:hypothetical protein [Dyella choica]RUL72480.1 hypothetical protein EKH80_17505 [Dyella choica]